MHFPETLTIGDLPEDVFGGRGEGESMADIMSQLGTSRVASECGDVYADEVRAMDAGGGGCTAVQFGRTPVWKSVGNGRNQNQRTAKASAVRPLHARPFGPSRAVGSTFGPAPLLPRHDLTAWEQERAASPERSYGPSAMTCVRRYCGEPNLASNTTTSGPFSTRSVSVPTTPSGGAKQWACASESHGALSLSQSRSEVSHASSGMLAHKIPARSMGRTLPNMHSYEDYPGNVEVLTPVRAALASSAQTRSFATSGKTGSHSSSHVGQQHFSPEAAVEYDDDGNGRDLGLDDVRRLQMRRRQLVSELNRTDRRLKDELSTASQSEFETSFQASPGGGGGAPFRQKRMPSAGGPFAGRRTANDRTVSTQWNQRVTNIAGTSYSYLGPGSDGPPLPEIHPLWS